MSIFLQADARRFAVPLIAKEYYLRYLHIDEGVTAVLGALSLYCDKTAPTDEDIEYFLSRLTEQSPKDEPKSAASSGPGFSTAYTDYLNGLPVDAIILRMAGFDYALARQWYCVNDMADALAAVQDYIRGDMELQRLRLEAVVFGMGGSFGDSETKVHVLDPDSPEADALFASWGMC